MKSFKLSLIIIFVFSLLSTTPIPKTKAALQEWTGTVTNIADGDTFDIAWDSISDAPEHEGSPITRIRVAGIDTNETDPSECYADIAETRLEQILPIGEPVKLVAEDKNSISFSGPQPRAIRHVFYGATLNTNVATQMIEEGMGLPANFSQEPSYKSEYFAAGEQAMLDEVGMWQSGVCGGTPASWPNVTSYVNYDAEGDDNDNLNGEYIEIQNNGSSTLNISDWTLRGSARLNGNTYTLPSVARVYAGGVHRVYTGSGTDTATRTYLGLDSAWLNNGSDVFYLRDEDLNVRLAKFWPCTVSCIPEKSVVVEDVSYDAKGSDADNPNGEWIRLRNVGNTTINLKNWRIKESGKFYRFDESDSIQPGKRFIVYIGSGSSSSSVKYWGNSSGILNNSGDDYVRVLNPDSVAVDCYTWGSGNQCGTEDVRSGIRMYANYNASGDDSKKPNGEWIAFRNTSNNSIDMSGFKVYTPGHTYVFPASTTIAANEYLRVRVGSGSDTTYNKFWGKSKGILNNSTDYVQLRSASDEVVFEHRWPCTVSCGYTYGLKIDKVNYNAPGDDSKNPNGEWIRIKNNSTATQDLQNWKIKVGPYQLVSVASRPMEPGESIKIFIGKGSNTSSKIYWGKSKGILLNSGDREVKLLSPLRHESLCYSWGSGSCD